VGKLKYIWQQNQGRSKARNLGISISTGKYLAFLDSDDKWHPEKLMNQVKSLEERRQKDKNIALVCSSVWLIDGDGNLLTSRLSGRTKNIEKIKLEEYLYRPHIFAPPSNALYYSDFVKEVGGFDDDIQMVEDWGLLIKLREKYKFVYLDKPLTYYRIHNVNQQGFASHDEINKKLEVLLRILEKFPKSKLSPMQINNARSENYERAAYWYFIYHDWENGLKKLIQAANIYPDCIENKARVILKVASLGFESALYNIGKKVPDLVNYFNEQYYINLNKIWPNELLSDPKVKKKIMATFCHLLVCDESIMKTRKENIQLCWQSFSYSRYMRSLTTWRIFIKNLLGINN
jgi:glycosyltransferase involved in cell wall biosynthesis